MFTQELSKWVPTLINSFRKLNLWPFHVPSTFSSKLWAKSIISRQRQRQQLRCCGSTEAFFCSYGRTTTKIWTQVALERGVRGKATMSRRSLLHFSALKIKISWYHREIRVRDKSFNFCPTVAATLSVEQRKLQIFIKQGLISPSDSLRLIFHSRIRIQPLSFNSILSKKWRCQSCHCFSSSADFEAEAVSLCTWAITVGFNVKSADGE